MLPIWVKSSSRKTSSCWNAVVSWGNNSYCHLLYVSLSPKGQFFIRALYKNNFLLLTACVIKYTPLPICLFFLFIEFKYGTKEHMRVKRVMQYKCDVVVSVSPHICVHHIPISWWFSSVLSFTNTIAAARWL